VPPLPAKMIEVHKSWS